MSRASAPLSIGVPVYNGERFLRSSVDALLQQTFSDFELIISDNTSTDNTPEICAELAVQDSRVRIIRQARNIGLAANFNAVRHAARSPLFKWAASDDHHEPTFLSRCLEELTRRPEVVLAYSRANSIDANGQVVRSDWGEHPGLGAASSSQRFRASLDPLPGPIPLPMFGVVRADVLDRTQLLVAGPDFDRALLAELSLHGPFAEVDELLFGQREHSRREGRKVADDPRAAAASLGGSAPMPHIGLLRRHATSVHHRPYSASGLQLYRHLSAWTWKRRGDLIADMANAAADVPGLGSPLRTVLDKGSAWKWRRRCEGMQRSLDEALPRDAHVVVIDDDVLDLTHIGDRSHIPINLKDGRSWGFPPDSESALAALADRRSEGATHVAVAFPAQWVLDYHREFAEHLETSHRCVLRTDDVVVYELS